MKELIKCTCIVFLIVSLFSCGNTADSSKADNFGSSNNDAKNKKEEKLGWQRCTNGDVFDISVSENTIYMSKKNSLDISEDNGKTWTSISKGLPKDFLISHIYSSGDSLLIHDRESGIKGVYFSSNKGKSWLNINCDCFNYLENYQFAFTNSSIIFVFEKGGIFSKPFNDDAWTQIASEKDFVNFHLIKVDNGRLFARLMPNKRFSIRELFYTSMDKINWIKSGLIGEMDKRGLGEEINDFCFKNDTIFAVNSSKVFMSADTCKSWELVYTSSTRPSWSADQIICVGDKLFVGTCNGVEYSIDNGVTWKILDKNWPINDDLDGKSVGFLAANSDFLFALTSGGYKEGSTFLKFSLKEIEE